MLTESSLLLERFEILLTVCAEKIPSVGGNESAWNEISVLIAGMLRGYKLRDYCKTKGLTDLEIK